MTPQFPISVIHQIEITSRCNLRCKYCPHPHMPRAKQDMEHETYLRTLQWASKLRGRELNLAGIGESTLHPRFVEYVFLAREAVGWDTHLILATNGLLMTRELAREIAPSGINVWVSLHRPEKAAGAVEALKEVGLLRGTSTDPSLAAIDWAGQVKWHTSAPVSECTWIKGGRGFVMADGRISRCCLDSTGSGVIGTVFDDLDNLSTSPYDLCKSCHLELGIEGHDQKG